MKKTSVKLFSLIKGYRFMSRINTELEKEGSFADYEALLTYESQLLTESEELDCKKRRYFLRRP